MHLMIRAVRRRSPFVGAPFYAPPAGVTATLAKTLDNVTASSAGSSSVTGTAGVALANVTSTAAGSSAITGATARTLADVTSTAAGSSAVSGAVVRTLADVVAASAGLVGGVTALGGGILAPVTLQSTGVVGLVEAFPSRWYAWRTRGGVYRFRTVPT